MLLLSTHFKLKELRSRGRWNAGVADSTHKSILPAYIGIGTCIWALIDPFEVKTRFSNYNIQLCDRLYYGYHLQTFNRHARTEYVSDLEYAVFFAEL